MSGDEPARTELRGRGYGPGQPRLADHPRHVCGGDRWIGNSTSTGLQPVHPDWTRHTSTDPGQAQQRWTERPYSVLLVTGVVDDVLDVPAGVGLRMVRRLPGDQIGPISVPYAGRWHLHIHPRHPLPDELAAHPDVTLHTIGSWVPMPPSKVGQFSSYWRAHPATVNWAPARAEVIHLLLAEALDQQP